MLEEALPMSRDFPTKPSGAGVDWFKVCGAVRWRKNIMSQGRLLHGSYLSGTVKNRAPEVRFMTQWRPGSPTRCPPCSHSNVVQW
jgi:hypothetical protein